MIYFLISLHIFLMDIFSNFIWLYIELFKELLEHFVHCFLLSIFITTCNGYDDFISRFFEEL